MYVVQSRNVPPSDCGVDEAGQTGPVIERSPPSGLFVLTAKTTQQEIYEKTLAAIDGESFRSVRLRAKERMCANDVVLCHENHCPYAKDYGAKMEASGLLDRLLGSHRHLDPDTVFEAARNETVCPFEVSLELADQAGLAVIPWGGEAAASLDVAAVLCGAGALCATDQLEAVNPLAICEIGQKARCPPIRISNPPLITFSTRPSTGSPAWKASFRR